MNMRKIAGVLLSTVAAVGLSVAVAQPAHAAPDPGVNYEIFTYFVGSDGVECVDVPGGSTRPGALLQIYRCHGSTNELWNFLDMGNGFFQIRNVNSNQCFELPSLSIRIEQAGCVGFDTEQWRIQVVFTSAGTTTFGLVNKAFPTQCLAADFPRTNKTPIHLKTCRLGNSIIDPGDGDEVWALG